VRARHAFRRTRPGFQRRSLAERIAVAQELVGQGFRGIKFAATVSQQVRIKASLTKCARCVPPEGRASFGAATIGVGIF
jgi:hypothetical protein